MAAVAVPAVAVAAAVAAAGKATGQDALRMSFVGRLRRYGYWLSPILGRNGHGYGYGYGYGYGPEVVGVCRVRVARWQIVSGRSSASSFVVAEND